MTTTVRNRTFLSKTHFVPDNERVTPRLKQVLQAGAAERLPPILAAWSLGELLHLRKDLRAYYLAASRELTQWWEQMSTPEHTLDARHAVEMRRKYGHQRRALAEVCIEIEDEIERALARAREAL